MRDAIHRELLTPAAFEAHAPSPSPSPAPVANQLAALLRADPEAPFSEAERDLLAEWLA